MANAYRSFAGEGYRSVATEVFSTPALRTGPKKDQTKMDLKNQSSAAGKSTLAIKTRPKMADLRSYSKEEGDGALQSLW